MEILGYIKSTLRESLIKNIEVIAENTHTHDDAVRDARVCPYCGGEPEFVDSEVVYGRSYGMIYLCRPCRAWVGVHKNSRKALGRLANSELREAKKEAHYYFDQLWRRAIAQGRSKTQARKAAYKWLSGQMNLPIEHTHIGMFDVEQCKRVVQICMPYIK